MYKTLWGRLLKENNQQEGVMWPDTGSTQNIDYFPITAHPNCFSHLVPQQFANYCNAFINYINYYF